MGIHNPSGPEKHGCQAGGSAGDADLKERTKSESFAEWFSLHPPVAPHFADYEPGTHVNGGVLTIVAGELAKAAFQHGFEAYGADILRRILAMVDKHPNDLPCCFRPDGEVDAGIPSNRGHTAVLKDLPGVGRVDVMFK